MLTLVTEAETKKNAQQALEKNLKLALSRKGVQTIGFRSGNVEEVIYTAGDNKLWAAFRKISDGVRIPRYWNAFGVYRPERSAQIITVEINIAINSVTSQVAGFLAEDRDAREIYIMHSGKVGGGRRGIGKSAFLTRARANMVEVAEMDGGIRHGIAVGKLGDLALAERIWKFVSKVQSFKEEAAAGLLETAEFRQRVQEFDSYSKEYSGTKKALRDREYEYISYHGDVVQKLYEERTARLASGEEVYNSVLVDLFVKRNGVLSEVYEVKTGIGRQVLYTAIGQMATHGAFSQPEVKRILVIPAEQIIPKDLKRAIDGLGIEVRRFHLNGPVHKRIIVLE